MTLRCLLTLGFTFATLAACGDAPRSSPDNARSDTAPRVGSSSAGRIQLHLVGETMDRNSRGDANSTRCTLSPSARNESRIDIKSLLAEFEVSAATDAGIVVVDPALTLVMPFRIAADESKDAWGPLIVDNHRCEALSIKLKPTLPGACRTTERKVPCPAYALSAVGVAKAD